MGEPRAAGERPSAPAVDGNRSLSNESPVVFARMSGFLLSQQTVETALHLITALAHETVPSALGSAVTLIDATGHRSAAATSHEAVEAADALQYALDEGPCLTAWAHRSPVLVDDTATEVRWPRWCRAVRSLGVASVLSVPLVAGDRAVGAMKVCSDLPSTFGPLARRRLSLLAPQAAVLLANMMSHQAATQLSEELKGALQSRDVISTAKGILMARDGVGPDRAFAMLVSASRRQNIKLLDVAGGIVAATVRRRP